MRTTIEVSRLHWRLVAVSLAVAALFVFAIKAFAGPIDGSTPVPPGAVATSVILKSSSSVVAYGQTLKLNAQLRTSSGSLKGKKLAFYALGKGETEWKLLSTVTTDSKGTAQLKLKADQGLSYSSVYAPTPADQSAYAPAQSEDVAVTLKPRITLALGRVTHGVLPGQSVTLTGTLRPATAGTQVALWLYRNGHKLSALPVVAKDGKYSFKFKATRGSYSVSVVSLAGADLAAGRSRTRHFRSVFPFLKIGSRGSAVRQLQSDLHKLGYWVGVNRFFGDGTGRAVLAFRKVTGMARTEVVNKALWSKLARGAGHFKLRHHQQGRYVEADLSRQVLVLAKDDKVYRILPTSSGKPSTPTIQGSFTFYQHHPGYNAKGMYYTVFFSGNYGVHGYQDVPPYAASHGCLRIPIANAVSVSNWVHEGDHIYVYP